MLTGSVFMLEVYDRVLPSHSIPTLVALTILAMSLYVALGILDLIRGRILVRVGAKIDEAVSDRVYEAVVCAPLKAGDRGDSLQALRHLDNLRSFLSGMGPIALFDLPWISSLSGHLLCISHTYWSSQRCLAQLSCAS